MTQAPGISVIVPVHNGALFVAQAIDSILTQPIDVPVELIAVDDGSTDATAAVLAQFGARIHVLSQPNGGPSAARNAGLAAARGSLIAFLDADDLWTDRHLASLLPVLSSDPAADYARGLTRLVEEDGNGHEMFQPALVGACLYRRSVFDKVGTFDESLRLGEDIDLHARLAEAGCREQRVQEVVLIYRRHLSATIVTSADIRRGQFDALRRRLARPAGG